MVGLLAICALAPTLSFAAVLKSTQLRKGAPVTPDLSPNSGKLLCKILNIATNSFNHCANNLNKLSILSVEAYNLCVIIVPRGGKIMFDMFTNIVRPAAAEYVKAAICMTEYLQISMVPVNKGEELVKDGSVLKREKAGKASFVCNMEVTCTFESDTLPGMSRHVTCTHLGRRENKRSIAELASQPTPGNPGQKIRMDAEKSKNESSDSNNETTVSQLARIAHETLNDTEWSQGDIADTPGRPFTQTNMVNSTALQDDKLENMMETDNDATFAPFVPSPDKAFREIPSDDQMLTVLEETRHFIGEGSMSATQGFVEEETPVEGETNPRLNHPFIYDSGNLEGETVWVCSVCGEGAELPEPAGRHLAEHLDLISYCPGLWKDRNPTCLTAVVDTHTTKRDMYFMIEELRAFLAKYETYYKEAEDCKEGRKTAALLLQEQIASLKEKLLALHPGPKQEDGAENDEKEVLLSTVTDLQDKVNELERAKESITLERNNERKKNLDNLKKAAAAKQAAVMSARTVSIKSASAIKEAEDLKSEAEELKQKLSATEFKLQNCSKTIKTLEKNVKEVTKEKESAEKLYEDAKGTLEEMLENQSEDLEVDVKPTWELNEAGQYLLPRVEEIDGKGKKNKIKPGAGSKPGSNQSLPAKLKTPKHLLERCMYHDRPDGCNDDDCKYAHPDHVCPDYLKKECELPRWTCLKGNHNKRQRSNILYAEKKKTEKNSKKENSQQVKKAKPGSSAAAQAGSGRDLVAVNPCPNWVMGACLGGLAGQPRCYAGAHIPELKGTGAVRVENMPKELFPDGPAENLATAGPASSRTNSQRGGRGRGRGQFKSRKL